MNEHALRLASKYPDRIAVIIDSDVALQRHKFLVPSDLTIGQFLYVLLKKRIQYPRRDTDVYHLLLKSGGIPNVNDSMYSVKKKSEVFDISFDGFLRLKLETQNHLG